MAGVEDAEGNSCSVGTVDNEDGGVVSVPLLSKGCVCSNKRGGVASPWLSG